MVWAACCLCLLRIGEAVSPGEGDFDPKVHLEINDIALDDIRHPSALEIHTQKRTSFGKEYACSWAGQERTSAQ